MSEILLKTENEIAELEAKLGVEFNNRDLLKQALMHESFVNEWNVANANSQVRSYDRLEYLGDAVLNYTVGRALFEKSSGANEGELSMGRSSIVCRDSLARVAQRLDLSDHILLGKGETTFNPTIRDSILEDSFEAIVGAIHVDQGYTAASRFVFDQLGDEIARVVRNGVEKDPKSAFQEMVQAAGLPTPRYGTHLINVDANHQYTYKAQVSVDGRVVATGYGTSKARAQKSAAAQAKDQFSSQMPERSKREAVGRRASSRAPQKDTVPYEHQENGSAVSDGMRRVRAWLSVMVMRRSSNEPKRRLIYRRPD